MNNFNPAQAWLQAMDAIAGKSYEEILEDKIKIKSINRAQKSALTLLAKNPNHFKELSAKAHAKRKMLRG